LPTLRAFLEKNPQAVAGPRCFDAASGRVVPTGFVGRKTFSADTGEVRAVQGLSGFCTGLGAEVAARLGPPDAKNFPHYAGDTAFTLRANRAGCAVVMVGDAVVELLDHGAGPATLEARVRAGDSLPDNWDRIFSATNSPYRLRTMWALQRLKYGALVGNVTAAARTVAWIARLVTAKRRGSL
jgi:hypothetical protein